LAIAIGISAVVAGCGGSSSSSSEDPQQVLNETFNNPTKITSGNLNISVDGTVQGAQSGDFSATITGPFQGDTSNTAAIPQLDLTAKASANGFSFDGAVITTKDNAYVEYQSQAYEVGADAFKQFAAAYAKSSKQAQAKQGSQDTSGLFKRFGIDPSTWLTNITNEGTTDVEGASTIHIHGDADVAQIVSDLQAISQATSGASTPQLTPDQLNQAKDSIQNASIDVYSGTDNHLLNKLALTLTIAPPASAGSTVSSIDINFSVTLADVNQPQTISAPSNPKPLSDLLGQFGLGGAIPGLGGSPSLAPPSGTGGGTSSAYLKCVQQATSPDEINACAQKIQ
jgi:hypothetical protein